jgi:hypothetical protein
VTTSVDTTQRDREGVPRVCPTGHRLDATRVYVVKARVRGSSFFRLSAEEELMPTTSKLAGRAQRAANPCPYCGAPVGRGNRKSCGSAQCKAALLRDRVRQRHATNALKVAERLQRT